MSAAESTKRLCVACSKWVPNEMSSCDCGHVFKELKSINGKRYTEGRAIYTELENEDETQPKKRTKFGYSYFYKEKVYAMTKLTSEEELTSEQKEKKKKKKKKKFNLLNEDYAHAHSRPSVSKGEKKERRTPSPYSDFVIDEKLLIQALDEINHKISNQQRLWMTL